MSEDTFNMPLVVTVPNGGPYDSMAYVCGWEAAMFLHRLEQAARMGGVTITLPAHKHNVPQLDLIAMTFDMKIVAIQDLPSVDGEELVAVVVSNLTSEEGPLHE